jgi:hypothetical protein
MDIEPQLKQACEYAEMGYRVFPVHGITPAGKCTCQGVASACRYGSPGKHPRVNGGYKAATTDRRQILNWAMDFPRSNVGVATGQNVLVADYDGDEGRELARLHGLLEDESVPLSVTGKGLQAFHRPPPVPVKCAVRVLPGLDIRADRGYVVVPPSRHVSGNVYTWQRPLPEPSQLPPPYSWYPLEKTRYRRPKAQAAGHTAPWGTASHSREILAADCARVAVRAEGERNSFLYDRAYFLAGFVRDGRLTQGEFIAGLCDAALTAGLSLDEVDCTLDSALRRRGVEDW